MHWVYHKEHKAKIVKSQDYESHLKEGWLDHPYDPSIDDVKEKKERKLKKVDDNV